MFERLQPRNWSLRTKLTGVIGIVVIAGGLFQWFYFPERMETVAFERAQRRASLIANVVATSIGPGLEFGSQLGDFTAVQDVLDQLEGSEIQYAAARDTDGNLVAQLNYRNREQHTESDTNIDVVDVDRAVKGVDGASIGTLTIGLSLAEMIDDKRQAQVTVLFVTGVLLVLGLFMSVVFYAFVARPIERVRDAAMRMANGDLSQEEIAANGKDEIASMSRAFNILVTEQRNVVRQISATSHQLASAAAQIFAASQEQEAAAQQQSAGMEEVSRTMDSLLESAVHISEVSQGVAENAEKTRGNIANLAEKVGELGGHTRRITEILETIREIADRSDLLALNASIEATRAGDAGRGFALVASEMRRLAERVTASVEDVKNLVADIHTYGSSTVMATEDGRKLADNNSISAKQIRLVTDQQRSATEQVTESMKEMSSVLTQSAAATQQGRSLAEELKRYADQLADTVSRFRLEDGHDIGQPATILETPASSSPGSLRQ